MKYRLQIICIGLVFLWVEGCGSNTRSSDNLILDENRTELNCVQVITHAYDPNTYEERDFPTPCDVPDGWIVGVVPIESDNQIYPPKRILKESAIDVLYEGISINKPSKGQSVVDNILDTKITQIDKVVRLDNKGKVKNVYSPYPKRQAWNRDMTLVRVGNRLYDAKTYQENLITKNLNEDQAWAKLCSRASDSFVWSNTM